jgi:hypothetical protein
MSWVCELTDDAKRDLPGLPKAIQKRVARTFSLMESDPFQGDIRALQGDEWKGVFAGGSAITVFLFTVSQAKTTV